MQFEQPFGLAGPPTGYALAATRHMHEYGTTSEQLAELAVSTRKWAQLNPRAIMRDPLTVDDVLGSRMISWPLHLLDCCLVTDAGGAVVVTSAERARDLPKQPVYVLGTGEASTHVIVSQMPDFAFWDAAQIVERARLRHVGRDARRHRRRDVLRRLHHRAGDGARGDRLLQAGRGRRRSSPAGARRRAVRSR